MKSLLSFLLLLLTPHVTHASVVPDCPTGDLYLNESWATYTNLTTHCTVFVIADHVTIHGLTVTKEWPDDSGLLAITANHTRLDHVTLTCPNLTFGGRACGGTTEAALSIGYAEQPNIAYAYGADDVVIDGLTLTDPTRVTPGYQHWCTANGPYAPLIGLDASASRVVLKHVVIDDADRLPSFACEFGEANDYHYATYTPHDVTIIGLVPTDVTVPSGITVKAPPRRNPVVHEYNSP